MVMSKTDEALPIIQADIFNPFVFKKGMAIRVTRYSTEDDKGKYEEYGVITNVAYGCIKYVTTWSEKERKMLFLAPDVKYETIYIDDIRNNKVISVDVLK